MASTFRLLFRALLFQHFVGHKLWPTGRGPREAHGQPDTCQFLLFRAFVLATLVLDAPAGGRNSLITYHCCPNPDRPLDHRVQVALP